MYHIARPAAQSSPAQPGLAQVNSGQPSLGQPKLSPAEAKPALAKRSQAKPSPTSQTQTQAQTQAQTQTKPKPSPSPAQALASPSQPKPSQAQPTPAKPAPGLANRYPDSAQAARNPAQRGAVRPRLLPGPPRHSLAQPRCVLSPCPPRPCRLGGWFSTVVRCRRPVPPCCRGLHWRAGPTAGFRHPCGRFPPCVRGCG